MKKFHCTLLLLGGFAFFAPRTVVAKDVGRHETVVKAEKNAITAPVACENAISVVNIVEAGQCQAATTIEVVSLTRTPTVEVKAKATVEGSTHNRLCVSATNFISLVIPDHNQIRSHIDPGLTV